MNPIAFILFFLRLICRLRIFIGEVITREIWHTIFWILDLIQLEMELRFWILKMAKRVRDAIENFFK